MVKNLRVVVTNDVASVPNWKSRACTHTWPSADDAQKHARKKEAEGDAAQVRQQQHEAARERGVAQQRAGGPRVGVELQVQEGQRGLGLRGRLAAQDVVLHGRRRAVEEQRDGDQQDAE